MFNELNIKYKYFPNFFEASIPYMNKKRVQKWEKMRK